MSTFLTVFYTLTFKYNDRNSEKVKAILTVIYN